ncbi:MAG: DEAD/DEAH box helicase [Myxococcota bacterium]
MESPSAPAPATFDAFGLRAEVLTALKGLGYEEPTPIQRETIPALISGRDVLGQAATGTGKTAAFALPMLEKISAADRRPFEAQALVLVPTRELAMQVAEAVQKYGAGIGVNALAVYGGQEIFQQIRPLKRGADVVIATPGRALDHIKRKTLQLKNVKVVVLDEADEMLDMGFEEDLQSILNELPATRQTALFSATLPTRIAKIAEKHLKDPVRVTIAARSVEAGTLPNIRQAAYVVQRKLKEAALMRVLEWETPQSAIIFCRTRLEVEELTHVLMRSGYEPAALHGGLTQEQRDGVLKRFKEGAVRVLVATDVAARGLHVENLSHVVNFDLPTSPEVYVHRIGRTGRAGKEGVALSFLDPRELRLLGNVERQIKKKVPVEPVPTRAQLDGRRSETVAARVKAALEDPRLPDFVELANKAADGSTLEAVAGAALLLLQAKLFPPHESDTADFPAEDRRGRSSRGERPERGERAERGERGERTERGERGPRSRGGKPGMTALTLSLGARAGVRPQDLVGAIANEANIPSRQIDGIRVDEFTSRVEVPSETVEQVIEALHATKIRGRKVRVEVERAGRPERAPRASAPRPRASAPRKIDAQQELFRAEDAPAGEVPSPDDEVAAPAAQDKPRFGEKKSFGDKPRFGDKRSFGDKPRFGEKKSFGDKPRFGEKKSFGDKPRFGEKKSFGDKPRFGEKREFGEKKSFGEKREFGEKKSFGDKPRFGEKKSFGDKPRFGEKREFGEKKSFGDKPRFGEKREFGEKKSFGDKPRFGEKKSFGDKPRFGEKKSFGDKPRFGSARGRMEPRRK